MEKLTPKLPGSGGTYYQSYGSRYAVVYID